MVCPGREGSRESGKPSRGSTGCFVNDERRFVLSVWLLERDAISSVVTNNDQANERCHEARCRPYAESNSGAGELGRVGSPGDAMARIFHQ